MTDSPVLTASDQDPDPTTVGQLAETTRPRAWVALVVTGVIIGAALVWACVATIPQLAEVPASIAVPDPTIKVVSTGKGRVSEIDVLPGTTVEAGRELLVIKGLSGESISIKADQPGVVTELVPSVGDPIDLNDELAAISPPTDGKLLFAVAFTTQDQASQFSKGDQVSVRLNSTNSVMSGTVNAISQAPASVHEMAEVLGTVTGAQEAFDAADGAPIILSVELGTDPTWTSDPPPYRVAAQQRVTIVRVVAEPHPIQWLFP